MHYVTHEQASYALGEAINRLVHRKHVVMRYVHTYAASRWKIT